MHVTDLHRYPVKSLRGEPLARVDVELWGLHGDRRWMLVDSTGEKLWAGRVHELLAVSANHSDTGGLLLRAEGRADLVVEPPLGAPSIDVTLRGLHNAVAVGDPADTWFRNVLGRDVRLVWLPDPSQRPMALNHGGLPGEPLSLADAAPLLLTARSSLRRLDEWAEQTATESGSTPVAPLSMERFRANVVIDGDLEPFAEDDWRHLRVGDVDFRFAELCDRCAVTTIEPGTLARGPEPLRSLARHRRWNGHVWFGIRIVPVTTGTIAQGDAVTVLSRT
jgi:uncharacterized protein YcbX